MDITNTQLESQIFQGVTNLTSNIENPKYGLIHYRWNKKGSIHFLNGAHSFSILLVKGRIKFCGEECVPEEGYLVGKESAFTLELLSDEAEFLVASSVSIELDGLARISVAGENTLFEKLSTYQVQKPWGWERWYTQGFELPYALKLIFMTQGQKSSLQSHKQKSETNIVISGEAEVLFGMQAPEDLTLKIDVSRLQSKIYRADEGWSNKVGEIHRVIAFTSYKAVEISTPELDDVIRWQDDAGRGHGRIETEHASGAKTL